MTLRHMARHCHCEGPAKPQPTTNRKDRMKRWHLVAAVCGATLVAACSDHPTAPAASAPEFSEFATPGNHVHVMPTQAQYANGNARPGGGGGGGTGIFYHGGPLLITPGIAAVYWSSGT